MGCSNLHYKELEPKVYTLPNEVDLKIAATKLGLMEQAF